MEPIPNLGGLSLRKPPVRRHRPVTRLASVAPGKVCRGNPGSCGLPREDSWPPGFSCVRNSWGTPGHQARKRGAKAQPTNNSVGGTEYVAGQNIPLQEGDQPFPPILG